MKRFAGESAQERWATLPLEWDEARMAGRPVTVLRNWAQMTERMRAMARAHAADNGPLTLVDVGCGNGGFADTLEHVIGRYIGVDPSETMLRQARQRPGHVYFCGIGEQLPLKDDLADMVILKSVLSHCYDPLRVLGQAARVLKPGGMLVIGTNNGRAWYAYPLRVLRRLQRMAVPDDGHLHRLDSANLTQWVTATGLRVREATHLGYGVLPRRVERWMSAEQIERFQRVADRIGRRLFPRHSGAFVLSAVKSEPS